MKRTLVQFRSVYNGEHVYLYHTTATPDAARELLVDVLNRVNSLSKEPEFYDTLTNNCTSNIVQHVIASDPTASGSTIARCCPARTPLRLAYDDGLIEHNGSFAETKEKAYVNDLADATRAAKISQK